MKLSLFVTFIIFLPSVSNADYRDDIGYTRLQTELGALTPNGFGITVAHVEAPTGAQFDQWLPDVNNTEFAGKNISDVVPASNGSSWHATGVGRLFYGNQSSMANAISDILVYNANAWLSNGFLQTENTNQPLVNNAKISNHSWIGQFNDNNNVRDPVATADALRRVDWLVETREAIQVVAMNNGSGNQPLLGSAYNVIAVGRSDAVHAQGSIALDNVYNAHRTRPDIVAPLGVTSSSTPVVAAAAAMLVEQSQTLSAANGERSEVVKAVMMAGADRVTLNTHAREQISDYRVDSINQSANGLDKRFGAGQLNVYNNYHIMAAGEQDSLQDGGGLIGMAGYDYDSNFGGANGSNSTASYFFSTDVAQAFLAASLVWNIDITGGNGANFNNSTTLHDLNLQLYNVTGPTSVLFAESSSLFDNSENLWLALDAQTDYELRVITAAVSFDWDYALAWQVTQVPLPGAVWLFASAIAGLSAYRRKYFQ